MISFLSFSVLPAMTSSAKNGVIAYLNTRLFFIAKDPTAAALYSASSTIIRVATYASFKFAMTLCGNLRSESEQDSSSVIAANTKGSEVRIAIIKAGILLLYPVAYATSVLAGKYLVNRFKEEGSPLSYREIVRVELTHLGELLLLND